MEHDRDCMLYSTCSMQVLSKFNLKYVWQAYLTPDYIFTNAGEFGWTVISLKDSEQTTTLRGRQLTVSSENFNEIILAPGPTKQSRCLGIKALK